jgi:hypothetical protein
LSARIRPNSSGQKWEIQCAKEEGKRIRGVRAYTNDRLFRFNDKRNAATPTVPAQRGRGHDSWSGHRLGLMERHRLGLRPITVSDLDEGRLNAARLGAIAHPIRVNILELTEADPVSPSDVAVALGEPLGVVAYPFRVLHTAGLIELVATGQRRGWVQSYYRAEGLGLG